VKPLAETSENFRFSAAVAGFGMLLRDSQHKGSSSYAMVGNLASGALGGDPHGYRRELLGMIATAKKLSPRSVVAR
jgi:Ca-activated chloride channel homolog